MPDFDHEVGKFGVGVRNPLEPVRELNESLESLVIQERRPESPEGSPMWTNENRARYDRSRLRYPSDLTDAEWGMSYL